MRVLIVGSRLRLSSKLSRSSCGTEGLQLTDKDDEVQELPRSAGSAYEEVSAGQLGANQAR